MIAMAVTMMIHDNNEGNYNDYDDSVVVNVNAYPRKKEVGDDTDDNIPEKGWLMMMLKDDDKNWQENGEVGVKRWG